MELRIEQATVVIVGRSHNPSLLNPDFLAHQGIVHPDWKWKTAEVITTPPLAFVRYENGVAIRVESERVQISDESPSTPSEEYIRRIARTYVQTLPHVRYTALGLNYRGLVAITGQSTEQFVIGRFLKPGPWNGPNRELKSAGIRMQYAIHEGGGTLNVSLEPKRFETARTDSQRLLASAVEVSANFHRPCRSASGIEGLLELIDESESDKDAYAQLANEILGEVDP